MLIDRAIGRNEHRRICLNTVAQAPDDRTIMRRVNAFFSVGQAPPDNKGWRKIIAAWLLAHPWYEQKYSNLPDTLQLATSMGRSGVVRVNKDGGLLFKLTTPRMSRIQEIAWAKQAKLDHEP